MIPTVRQWSDATWYARTTWAQRHGLSVAAAHRAVLNEHRTTVHRRAAAPPPPVRADVWSDTDHAASLAGDHDPDVVLRRRAEAAGVGIGAPFLTTPDLPRRSRV